MEKAKFLNTYEATVWHLNTTDTLICRTTGAVWRTMNTPEFRDLAPQSPFDVLYLYIFAVKSISEYVEYTLPEALPTYKSNFGVNYPLINDETRRDSRFAASGIEGIFIGNIRRAAIAKTNPFDVGYACSIMHYAIDHKFLMGTDVDTLSWIAEGKGQTHKPLQKIVDDGELSKYWR